MCLKKVCKPEIKLYFSNASLTAHSWVFTSCSFPSLKSSYTFLANFEVATSKLARKVYDDFKDGKEQEVNTQLCAVREAFEKYNLISGLHTFFKHKDSSYENLLPPLRILNKDEATDLLNNLEKLNFSLKSSMAA